MDAIVTTPKSEIENARREGEEIGNDPHSNAHWFRVFKFKPKVEPGDKLFFVESGEITGYGVVFAVDPVDQFETCDITDRMWEGNWAIRYKDWHWLDPRPKMRGFQGLRYVERLPVELKEALCVEAT